DFRDNSFDALACDPPYGFSFMNKAWDYDVPSAALWRECLRVLKPGAPLLAFGGARTYHRLACGIEDAGFELCDKLEWIYAKGMPKPATTTDKYIDAALGVDRPVVGSRRLQGTARLKGGGGYTVEAVEGNYDEGELRDEIAVTAPGSPEAAQWEGFGHALRPSHEPIALACKPFDGTIAHNVLTHGVGGLDIAGCRLPRKTRENPRRINEGCWPANVIFSHAADCGDVCSPACPSRQLDEQSGERPSNPFRANVAGGAVLPFTARAAGGLKDTGGASRFFYCTKVSRKEREAGCEHLALKTAAQATNRREGTAGANRPQAGAGRGSGCRNFHPTLKPISLTTWLTRLILPPTPGAVLLVPFAGAGSEMIGALKAGWGRNGGGVFGIEREAEYAEIARARLRHWCPEATGEGEAA